MFFYKADNECDFVIFDRDKPVDIIQVAYDIGDRKTLERELSGLADAAGYFGLKRGKIITFDTEREPLVIPRGVTAEIVPAFKWFTGISD